MGEHIFRVLLSELSIVRIVCQKCETVVEVPTDNIDTLQGAQCPGCQQHYYTAAERSPNAGFLLIKRAIDAAKVGSRYRLEFPVRLAAEDQN